VDGERNGEGMHSVIPACVCRRVCACVCVCVGTPQVGGQMDPCESQRGDRL